jgi:hypothetical protein
VSKISEVDAGAAFVMNDWAPPSISPHSK